MFRSLVERDKDVIWHPYTQMRLAADPLPIVRGEGVYLVDEAGNRYIDAISNWWVNLHGHGHPYLAQKIYEQAMKLEQVIFAGFTHQPAVELAERVLGILPGQFSKVFYSDNGSTAVEVALKMAIQYWGNKGEGGEALKDGAGEASNGNRGEASGEAKLRKKILALTHSYHGDTFGAMSVSERGVFTLAFQDYLFEVLFIEPPATATPPVTRAQANPSIPPGPQAPIYPATPHPIPGDAPLLHRQGLEIDWDEIACFIYEPLVQGAGGMIMYDAEWLNALLKKCKQHNIICIADEVMTGFGRTGKLFASEYMEEKPDIMCLSKGLTGGMMALGATVCTQKIYDAFLSEDRSKTFFHGHSYTANPIACAAGNASMDLLMAPEAAAKRERIRSEHEKFAQRLQSAQLPVQNVRYLGTSTLR